MSGLLAGLRGSPSPGPDSFVSPRASSTRVPARLPGSQRNASGSSAQRGALQVECHKLRTQKLEKQNTEGPGDRPAKVPTSSPVAPGRLLTQPGQRWERNTGHTGLLLRLQNRVTLLSLHCGLISLKEGGTSIPRPSSKAGQALGRQSQSKPFLFRVYIRTF